MDEYTSREYMFFDSSIQLEGTVHTNHKTPRQCIRNATCFRNVSLFHPNSISRSIPAHNCRSISNVLIIWELERLVWYLSAIDGETDVFVSVVPCYGIISHGCTASTIVGEYCSAGYCQGGCLSWDTFITKLDLPIHTIIELHVSATCLWINRMFLFRLCTKWYFFALFDASAVLQIQPGILSWQELCLFLNWTVCSLFIVSHGWCVVMCA